jgi:hypothetical protein
MKCNKCLKTIPKGEEIRFGVKKPSSNWRAYGGCYCESCWKDSSHYQYYENKGKSSDSSGFPEWGWFVIVAVVVVLVIIFGVWLIGGNDRR